MIMKIKNSFIENYEQFDADMAVILKEEKIADQKNHLAVLRDKRVFITRAYWYENNERILMYQVEHAVKIMSAQLPVKYAIVHTSSADAYMYFISDKNEVYSLIGDLTHDNDSFSIDAIRSYDIAESIQEFTVPEIYRNI